jgi:hypothetical protein
MTAASYPVDDFAALLVWRAARKRDHLKGSKTLARARTRCSHRMPRRKFAEEWTYRFLAAALSDADGGDQIAE